jgi:hypothetical protein
LETNDFTSLVQDIKQTRIRDIAQLCAIVGHEDPLWGFVLRWRSEVFREVGTYRSAFGDEWREGQPIFPDSNILGFYRCLWLEEPREPVGKFNVMIVEEVVTVEEYRRTNHHLAPHFLSWHEEHRFGTHQCDHCGAGTEENPEPQIAQIYLRDEYSLLVPPWESEATCMTCSKCGTSFP